MGPEHEKMSLCVFLTVSGAAENGWNGLRVRIGLGAGEIASR